MRPRRIPHFVNALDVNPEFDNLNFKSVTFYESETFAPGGVSGGSPLFYGDRVFGVLLNGLRYRDVFPAGSLIENLWKDYTGNIGESRGLTDWLDPDNTWISVVNGGYLKDLIKNKPVDFDLNVGDRIKRSIPMIMSTKDFFPEDNIGEHREAFLGFGMLGPNVANDTYLTLHGTLPNGPEEPLLYGSHFPQNVNNAQPFQQASWNVDHGVRGVIATIPAQFNYPANIESTDIQNLILQYLRFRNNRTRQIRNGISASMLPVIAKIRTGGSTSKVRAVKFPNIMPMNAVQLFDRNIQNPEDPDNPDAFHKKMWQSYKYAENRGENSTDLHIKSIKFNGLEVSKTIKTEDNGGYLNLVNTNYKIGPIKTSIKLKGTDVDSQQEEYTDIKANFVTITMDIHNPNHTTFQYGVWIDYFNTEALDGIDKGNDENTYSFVHDGTVDENGTPQSKIHQIEDVKNPYPEDHQNAGDLNNFVEDVTNFSTISFKFKMPDATEIKLNPGEKRTTRLRIGIYHDPTATEIEPHGVFPQGEVEDYLIEIQAPTEEETVRSKAKIHLKNTDRIRPRKRNREDSEDSENPGSGSLPENLQLLPPSSSQDGDNAGNKVAIAVGIKDVGLSPATYNPAAFLVPSLLSGNYTNFGHSDDNDDNDPGHNNCGEKDLSSRDDLLQRINYDPNNARAWQHWVLFNRLYNNIIRILRFWDEKRQELPNIEVGPVVPYTEDSETGNIDWSLFNTFKRHYNDASNFKNLVNGKTTEFDLLYLIFTYSDGIILTEALSGLDSETVDLFLALYEVFLHYQCFRD